MKNLATALSYFTPISLQEMDHVQLLDRIDTKYVIHKQQLSEYLRQVTSHYRLLKINDKLVHPYETLYFDTPGFQLYKWHHNGIWNRYKLRCRKYVNTGTSFFEIKTKTNKNRTSKARIQINGIPDFLDASLQQYVDEHIHERFPEYIPALRVFFDRITLVNTEETERLTFDLNLRYECKGVEKKISNIVVVELKQGKHAISIFRELMKKNHQHQGYLSKYCIGLASMQKDLKANNFKHNIFELKKLGYEIN